MVTSTHPDVIFLQETYSSSQTIKFWEAEWGGKIVESHGSNHSRGVMILFKPKINVSIEKIVRDKNGTYVLNKVYLDDEKFCFFLIFTHRMIRRNKFISLETCHIPCLTVMQTRH